MTSWRVCGKWTLEVDLEQEEARLGEKSFDAFPVARMSRSIICREALLSSLPPLSSALELFGGLGLSSTILRGRNDLMRHLVVERDARLVRHLRRNGFNAVVGDALTEINIAEPSDLLDCDFGRFTILQWERSAGLQGFSAAAFGQGHGSILFTDEAIVMLGMNRSKYARVLGCPVAGIDDYVNGWSRLWWNAYGYSIRAAQRHRGAVYTLWQPGPPSPVTAASATADYLGIEVLV